MALSPASATQNIFQGQEVLLRISEDNGTTWLYLVCAENQTNDATRDMKERTTQCGTIVGKGASVKRNIGFKGVYNRITDAVASGEGYASGKNLKTWLKDGTALIVEQVVGDGTTYKNKSNAYVSNYKEDIPVDDVIGFDVSFFMWGTWTIAG